MNTKFDAVPLEKDTNVLFQLNATLGDYDVLYQMCVKQRGKMAMESGKTASKLIM